MVTNRKQIVVQVGGEVTDDWSLGGSNNIVFTTAPGNGVQVRITKKLGSVWYNQGSSTASDGAGLQASTGVEVKFLQKSAAELPEN